MKFRINSSTPLRAVRLSICMSLVSVFLVACLDDDKKDDPPVNQLETTATSGLTSGTVGTTIGTTAGTTATAGTTIGTTAGTTATAGTIGTTAGTTATAGTTIGTTAGTTATAGTTIGTTAGTTIGATAGTTVGTTAGTTVGTTAGTTVGTTAGTIGTTAGTTIGTTAGTIGTTAGTTIGTTAGTTEGTTIGTTAGTIGTTAGTTIGTTAGTIGTTAGPTTDDQLSCNGTRVWGPIIDDEVPTEIEGITVLVYISEPGGVVADNNECRVFWAYVPDVNCHITSSEDLQGAMTRVAANGALILGGTIDSIELPPADISFTALVQSTNCEDIVGPEANAVMNHQAKMPSLLMK